MDRRTQSPMRSPDQGRPGVRIPWFVLLGLLLLPLAPAHAQPVCVGVGDCDAGGTITVDELVKGVNLVLGTPVAIDCLAFGCRGSADVTTDCVVQAVRGALDRPSLGVSGTERIDVGGHRLRIRCVGAGEPTVVLDTGLGDVLEIWVAVQPAIAGFTRVCAYDRAGYGSSDPGPLPRDSAQIVSELHALLGNGCLPGPYILVGHSLGGLHIHLYASTYPQEVAGLLFVDGRPAGFYEGLQELQPPLPPDLYARYVSCDEARPAAAMAECLALPASENEVAAAEPLPQVPMTVLVAGKSDPGVPPVPAAQTGALWLQLQTELADSVPGARLTVVDDCAHYIHLCRPDLITATVQEMVEGFRARQERAN